MADQEVTLSSLCHFTDKQLEATRQADTHDYTLFGGAAGPGKSYWLRWYPIRQLIRWGKDYNLKGIHGALFSEDYPTLKDRQISKMEVEFPRWLGEIKDTKTDGLGFHLRPEYGSHVLMLRNLDDPSKYLSSEFAIIAVDELTMNDEEKFHQLRSRMRWTGIPNPKFVAATNPGQQGHEWVKRRWIDRNFPIEEQGIMSAFAYVPALPKDNPNLAESYLKTLASLPEKKRKAYLDGNWDVFEGQFFTEWDRDKHVVKPYTLPEHWVRLRSIDPSGRAGITSCHWYALSSEGSVVVYREYVATGRDHDEHAKHIAKLSEGETYPYTCIDGAAFSKLGLPETTAEVYERHGVQGLVSSMKNRVMGWNTVHQYLRWVEKDALGAPIPPKLTIFSTCPQLIRTIPLALHDEKNPEDIQSFLSKVQLNQDGSLVEGSEHQDCLDELRYLLQTLREQKAPKSLSIIEKRIAELKHKQHLESFNYRYSRNK